MPLTTALLLLLLFAQARVPEVPADQTGLFESPYLLAEMTGKQAVVETTMGTFVLQLLAEQAPNQVAYFMTLARNGGYDGTIFHRVVRDGIIQGGDPISRDASRADEYGSGGLNRLRAESRELPHVAGAVSAVTLPGDDNSAGSQFLICVGPQPSLDGQFAVFALVVEGSDVVRAISAVEAGPEGLPLERVAITGVTIRDAPPEPFVEETAAELADVRAVLETTLGEIELEMLPDRAPVTVRRFLQMAAGGVYDGIAIHRVASNFVIQTGALFHRSQPLLAEQQRLVGNLPPEFTDTPNEPGIVSMARDADPGSGSTSFFICIGACNALTGQYTVFARVSAGMDVVDAIAGVPVDGETPVTPIVMSTIRTEPR